jgi:anti-sigma factor RsiW
MKASENMADPVDSSRPGDGELVAYIDGALEPAARSSVEERLGREPAVRARLAELRAGDRPFAEAYAVLIDAAPVERLEATFAGVRDRHGAASSGRRRLAAIAAAIAIFAAGAAVGTVLPSIRAGAPTQVAEPAPPPNWRQVVAEYQTLTTVETLSVIADSPAVLADELSAVGARLALDLSPEKLALPHLYLKRAELLEFRGRPLAQLAYLSGDHGPMAFCIIANGRPDAGLAFEQREGSNIVFWTRGGLGYMLIGHAPRGTLEALAGELESRLG